ncbi:hypothetical protein ACFFV7_14640 [Nonomuraea spiralis]|uniref:Uncharacterized protein n=1 Tax=Nonomuraea spiralis TaxID=46182 RepID=A0ABV5ID13_9ACTN|nr:hypothetical protein [Nonomuraea spiralis]GGT20497.1 hypothetical protein GCM10010176_076230 [Nonomuraea spiralis]
MKNWRIVLLPALALAATVSAVPAEAVTAQKKVLVELREEGGYAGLQNRVTVYTDGCVRLGRRTGPVVAKCLMGKEQRQLRGYLKELKIGRSERPPQGADFLSYTLAYKGHRATRYNLPRTWKPVVAHLDKILVKYWAAD